MQRAAVARTDQAVAVLPRMCSPGIRMCGLGIVEEHDVARAHDVPRAGGVRRRHLGIVFGLARREQAGVTGGPVQSVVDPLGDGEEPGVPGDHVPADVDPGVLDVPDENLEHLGDPAPRRRRVDVPDDASREGFRPSLDQVLERTQLSRGQHRRRSPRPRAPG